MAIKFFNIRSKEVRVAETEPQISAMWGSSDRGPNVTQGQDMGWRLAPEVVVELRRIKTDQNELMQIATRLNIMLEDVDEKAILQYISAKTDQESAPVAQDGDYTDEYEQEIRRLEKKDVPASEAATPEVATTESTTEPDAGTVTKAPKK